MIAWMDFVFDEILGPVLVSNRGESLIRVLDQDGENCLTLNQEASMELNAALTMREAGRHARARMAESNSAESLGNTKLENLSSADAGMRSSESALTRTSGESDG